MSTVEPFQDGEMSKAPAFQFYASDFLIGTLEMSLAEIGLYIKLLALSWDKGALPTDQTRLARLAGVSESEFNELWRIVGAKWTETEAGYINERLEEQRAKYQSFVAEQAEKGKRGARKRWANDSRGHAPAIAVDSHGHAPAIAVAMAPAIERPLAGDSRGHAPAIERPLAGPWPNDSSSVFSLQSSDQDQDQDQERESERRLTPLPPPQSLVEAWNSGTTAPIPKCRELTPKRRRHAVARLREAPIDIWHDVIARIEASAFCRGQNDRGWVATFDWLLQPETRVKVLEGKYDNRAPTLVPSGRRAVDKTTRALQAAQIAIARHRAAGGQ